MLIAVPQGLSAYSNINKLPSFMELQRSPHCPTESVAGNLLVVMFILSHTHTHTHTNKNKHTNKKTHTHKQKHIHIYTLQPALYIMLNTVSCFNASIGIIRGPR